MPNHLLTPQGQALTGVPWQVYPRPQMRRDSYVNLNGLWDFAVGKGPFRRKILVPFCPESPLSGIHAHFRENAPLRYRRRFTLPEGFRKNRVLLHIGAADQHLICRVNGQVVGRHSGGYDAMTFDITQALQEENELCILCRDDLRDKSQPYGKQTTQRGGMWYTPVSGIWQTVWLESVPKDYIQKLKIVCHGTAVTITTVPALEGEVSVSGVGTFPLAGGSATICPPDPHLWSPEDPYLYDFTVTTGSDRVSSYFALRTLEIREAGGFQRLCLNGRPYFFHGVLDQGYWPDGLFTPADPSCFEQDILAMKRLGFNTLRKHIKVEIDHFYYLCDKLGMVVFQDMVNNGAYHFLRDSALPTLGLQVLGDRHLHTDPATRHNFLKAMERTVDQLGNHPCVVYWTIFNEGWGQFDADDLYHHLKALDPTRWIDATSGWFRRKDSDVDSRHVYFRDLDLNAGGRPLVLSEFGGYAYCPADHTFDSQQKFGYRKFQDPALYAQAVEALYMEQVVPAAKAGLCAAIYTQLSDVEDEINGLVSYDRQVEKLLPQGMLPIAQALQEAIK